MRCSRNLSSAKHEIKADEKKPVTGDYTLTDNSFPTKITLGSDWIEPKITWERRLPESPKETEAFFVKNNTQIHAAGSKRNINFSLN